MKTKKVLLTAAMILIVNSTAYAGNQSSCDDQNFVNTKFGGSVLLCEVCEETKDNKGYYTLPICGQPDSGVAPGSGNATPVTKQDVDQIVPMRFFYECLGTTQKMCVPVYAKSGKYATADACVAKCISTPSTAGYNCVNNTCTYVTANATYSSLTACQANCKPSLSCTVQFNPSTISKGGSTTASWSSQGDYDGKIPWWFYWDDGTISSGVTDRTSGTEPFSNLQQGGRVELLVADQSGNQQKCTAYLTVKSDGYNCINNTCTYVTSNAQYGDINSCLSNCSSAAGYNCVNGNCTYVTANATYGTLSACQNDCRGGGGGGSSLYEASFVREIVRDPIEGASLGEFKGSFKEIINYIVNYPDSFEIIDHYIGNCRGYKLKMRSGAYFIHPYDIFVGGLATILPCAYNDPLWDSSVNGLTFQCPPNKNLVNHNITYNCYDGLRFNPTSCNPCRKVERISGNSIETYCECAGTTVANCDIFIKATCQ